MEESIQRIVYDEPIKIQLERGQRGGYGWTISVRGKDSAVIIGKIKDLDDKLKSDFIEEAK